MKLTALATATAIATLTLAGAVACSSSKPAASPASKAATHSANNSDQAQLLKFTQCMRDHGVDMPDPQSGQGTGATGGGGVGTLKAGGSGGIDLSSGSAAYQACRQFLPNGGVPQKPSAAQLAQELAFAKCMRAHGIDYPDPQPDGSIQGVPMNGFDQSYIDKMNKAERACDTSSNSTPSK